MFASQLDDKAIPTKTTNFLSPCNEDSHDENMTIIRSSRQKHKNEFGRSQSCDISILKKPHPFRSPITFLRTTTLPRAYKKRTNEATPDYHTRLKTLTVSPEDSGWSLDDSDDFCLHQVIHSTATTENTPFSKTSNQLYYTRRQTVSNWKLKSKNTTKSHHNEQLSFDGHYATMQSPHKRMEESIQMTDSLRRRASSLDFLPDTINKSCSQNGNFNKTSPFARTISLSQRSPFRKKIAFPDPETSLAGLKESRPKGAKRCKNGIDALFDCIERQDVEELRKLINNRDVNINDMNPDQFTPLEVALMNGETEIATVLLNHGATENPSFSDPENRVNHLDTLIENADKNVNDFAATIVNCIGDVKDNERQLREWEWRLHMLKVMRNGFLSSDCPAEIPYVTLAPLSKESVVVSLNLRESDEMLTKYKVQWSRHADFSEIEGEQLISDKRQLNYTISALEKNVSWYVRAQTGNLKGFSLFGYPEPRAVIPSSWHECDNSVPRYYGASDALCKLIDELYVFQKQTKKPDEDTSDDEVPTSPQGLSRVPTKQRNGKNVVMKSLSKYTNLIFNSAPKLLKKIKGRGIYLAALLYNDDLSRVLVTMDDNLPVVECDDSYSKSFTQEFYWFSKASCTWEDIQHMLYFSTKSHSSQSVQIRRKLMQSALVLQNATGVNDLGPIHYRPFKDNHGSILLLSVNCIKKPLNGSRAMTMKWIPIQKLLKKTNSINEQVMVPERLIPSVQEQVACHRRSRMHLPRGLYLGYLKLRTSVEALSIIVPNSHTNVLPYVKIQDVPNVTREEWEWSKNANNTKNNLSTEVTASLQMFQSRLKTAINKLFSQLNIPNETILSHRIYDQEVIELNSEVLFILICPPCDEICTPPNQTDGFTSLPAYSALPVQAFEMSNMMTYQPKLMSSYSRLSSILELEHYCSQQSLRETINHNECKNLKEKQSKMTEFQQAVDDCWKNSRWVVDTIQACQDKNLNVGISLSLLFRTTEWSNDITRMSISSHSDVSIQDSDGSLTEGSETTEHSEHVLTIHGTNEIGLSKSSTTTVTINDQTTTRDIIQMAAANFLTFYNKRALDTSTPPPADIKDILNEDNLQHLGLVVVCGSRERCLRDDLNLKELRTPWEKGTLYLRLRKEALRATKWGLSTSV